MQSAHYVQPPVWTTSARKKCKLKCKAGLHRTLMKSHIKPCREWMCTGGAESEAKSTGSSASSTVSLPLPLSLFPTFSAVSSPQVVPALSVGATSGSFVAQTETAWLGVRER